MLATVVTFAHTASVVLIGVAVLAAGHYVVPGIVVPSLEIGAGLLVAVLGVRLLARRWRPVRGHDHGHIHDHDHAHPHPTKTAQASLLTMGVSGGIVSCPEALGVLLLAVGVNRTTLGLGMIVAFSLGLATVLVGLGLLVVTARFGTWLRRRRPSGLRLGRLVPLGSASVVAVLGVEMALRGAVALVGR